MIKQILEKQPSRRQGVNQGSLKSLTTPEISIPSRLRIHSDKSKGFWRLN